MAEEKSCKVFEQPNVFGGKEYTIYIEEFDDYRRYIEAINIVRTASSNDTIVFVINSPGGYIDIMDAFLHAIDISEARVISAEIAGEACSAAAILALACDELYVTYNSVMLIHSMRAGYYGKVQDLEHYTDMSKIQNNRIATRYYKHFLTDDEIDDVLTGKELWLTAEEIEERWKMKAEENGKELEKMAKEQEKRDIDNIIEFLKEKGFKVERIEESVDKQEK